MTTDFIDYDGLEALKAAAQAAYEVAPSAPWYASDSPVSGLPEELGCVSISSPEHGCFIEVPATFHPDSAAHVGERIPHAEPLVAYLAMLDPESTLELIEQLEHYKDSLIKLKSHFTEAIAAQTSIESNGHLTEMAKLFGFTSLDAAKSP